MPCHYYWVEAEQAAQVFSSNTCVCVGGGALLLGEDEDPSCLLSKRGAFFHQGKKGSLCFRSAFTGIDGTTIYSMEFGWSRPIIGLKISWLIRLRLS